MKSALLVSFLSVYLILISGAVAPKVQAAPLEEADLPIAAAGSAAAPTQVAALDAAVLARSLSTAFENVANQITPSVVNIVATKKVKARAMPRGALPNDPFFDQFRRFFGEELPQFQYKGPQENYAQGMGTGVIIDSRGHILTNNHVIADGDDITVKLHDQSSHKAQVVGRDPMTDLAVIRITASNLVPARLGDSDRLKIGEWVVAAGNPFGLDHSITAGIVSAKGRSIMGGGQFEDFIQTDAAINPGNSGGPLLNLDGEVIGINTAIFSRSGGYMGIGFAIPINMASAVTESLISKGKVVRGWLGVLIQNLSEELSSSLGHTGTEGALVGDIQPESPAAAAGVKQGDIIISINGQKVTNVNQLRNTVATTKPGVRVDLKVIRAGSSRTISVKIGELPTEVAQMAAPTINEPIAVEMLGITVEDLTADLSKSLKSRHGQGIVVTSVDPSGLAASSGIQVQDIIISVNGADISSVQQFQELVTVEALKRGLRLVVENDGMQRFAFITAK